MATQRTTMISEAGPAAVTASTTALASMAVENAKKDIITRTTSAPARDEASVGHPQEQFEVEEAAPVEENIEYPTGPKLWLTFVCLCIAMFLHGFDLAIVAVAVPRLTDEFKTVSDIGWYSAAYPLAGACVMFFFGKSYTLFRTKWIYLFGLAVFNVGSLLCTLAPNSMAFIAGRAIAGLGSAACGAGIVKIMKGLFPLSKQALYCGIVGASQSVGLVAAPSLGGVLVDAFTWRGCFGINVPLIALCVAFTAWAFEDTNPVPDMALPFKEKLKRLDLFGTLLVAPSIACLLLALQWGGLKYGWNDWRIIVLFVVFAVLFSVFGYVQYRLGEKAVVPLRFLKQRNILGALWLAACVNGILGVTEYYISIYFQGVRGYTPTQSGLLGIPMLVGLLVATMVTATGVSIIGYYYPFMFATSLIAPIASGFLTTVDLDGSPVKPAALLGLLGTAVGLSLGVPMLVVQATCSSKDVSIANAIVGFGSGIGSALWVCVSATLFQNRLGEEIAAHSPSTNVTALEKVGLSDIRRVIGPDKLKGVLFGYNEAVVQTLYLPLALTCATIVATVTIERRNLKKKAE